MLLLWIWTDDSINIVNGMTKIIGDIMFRAIDEKRKRVTTHIKIDDKNLLVQLRKTSS